MADEKLAISAKLEAVGAAADGPRKSGVHLLDLMTWLTDFDDASIAETVEEMDRDPDTPVECCEKNMYRFTSIDEGIDFRRELASTVV